MRNYQGSKNRSDCDHFTLSLPITGSWWPSLSSWLQHTIALPAYFKAHDLSSRKNDSREAEFSSDKQETIFCESQKWAQNACCNLVFDKTTFHYCKSLRIFRQHKFCKLNLIFPDRNTLYRSQQTCNSSIILSGYHYRQLVTSGRAAGPTPRSPGVLVTFTYISDKLYV